MIDPSVMSRQPDTAGEPSELCRTRNESERYFRRGPAVVQRIRLHVSGTDQAHRTTPPQYLATEAHRRQLRLSPSSRTCAAAVVACSHPLPASAHPVEREVMPRGRSEVVSPPHPRGRLWTNLCPVHTHARTPVTAQRVAHGAQRIAGGRPKHRSVAEPTDAQRCGNRLRDTSQRRILVVAA